MHSTLYALGHCPSQVDKIKEELNKFNYRLNEFAKLSVFTVDEFQVTTSLCIALLTVINKYAFSVIKFIIHSGIHYTGP